MITQIFLILLSVALVTLGVIYRNELTEKVTSFVENFSFPEMSDMIWWLIGLFGFIYVTQFVWLNDDGTPFISAISPGRISLILFTIFVFLLFVIISKQTMKKVFPSVWNNFRETWATYIKQLSPWQKLLFPTLYFFLLLYALVLIYIATI